MSIDNHEVRRKLLLNKNTSPVKPFRLTQRTPNKGNGIELKRKIIVAETPEDKIAKRRCTDDDTDDVVEATPMEKCNHFSRRDSQRLNDLIKEAQKKRASKRLSFVPSTSCTQSQPETQSMAHSQSVPEPTPSNLHAGDMLTSEILQRYRKRMEAVRLESKKTVNNSSDIFYGRSAGRVNLFSEEFGKEVADERRQTRSTAQKNRSGRKVNQDGIAVFMAHSLLNVHNETPLLPFKAPRDSAFKIRKLVRHATKADWKKLQKFMAKSQSQERSDSSSSRRSAS